MKNTEPLKETGAAVLAGTEALEIYLKAIVSNLESMICAFGALDEVVVDTKSRQGMTEVNSAGPVAGVGASRN